MEYADVSEWVDERSSVQKSGCGGDGCFIFFFQAEDGIRDSDM